jgi:alpha-tubulin suppressor-like RCC1 family protein
MPVFTRCHAPAFTPWRWLPPVLGVFALACGEEVQSPDPAGDHPALATTTAALAFQQISPGLFHTCGLTTAGRAYCWGQNVAGQLGDGTHTTRSRPVAVATTLQFVQLSAGAMYTCGVTAANKAYCWGQNTTGQLGDGTKTDRSKPVPVVGGRSFRLIHPGYLHTCALTPHDEAFCWGNNSDGQLGDATRTTRTVPVRVHAGTLRFRNVFAAGLHTCGATTTFVGKCWGRNEDGQLGDNTTIRKLIPVTVAGGHAFRQVAVGAAHGGSWLSHSCGLTTGDLALCWGYNASGDLGDGTTTRRLVPVPVAGNPMFRNLSPGAIHTCGVLESHLALCWGSNGNYQLGDSTNIQRNFPVHVSGGLQWNVVSAGTFHTCGITTAGKAYCWGINFDGQLGLGTIDDPASFHPHSTPEAVVGP